MNVFITKNGQASTSEVFEPVKLHGSIIAACLSVRAFEGEAHLTAQKVIEKVLEWLETKTEVTSEDIRRVASAYLGIYRPDAAYVYQNYHVMV